MSKPEFSSDVELVLALARKRSPRIGSKRRQYESGLVRIKVALRALAFDQCLTDQERIGALYGEERRNKGD